MKKIIGISVLLLSVCTFGNAQEVNEEKSTLKIYRVEKTEQLTKEQEIQNCKDHITALDQKEAWIRSNPEELKIATENGWFEEAAATRARLLARIKELESGN